MIGGRPGWNTRSYKGVAVREERSIVAHMNSLTSLTAQQFRAAADLKERIQALERELGQLLGQPTLTRFGAAIVRRRLSAQAIANIRAGVRKRMAAARARMGTKAGAAKPKRKISAAGRAAIAAAARVRWARAKASGRNRL